MARPLLTLTNLNHPFAEFLEDFSDGLFNMNKILDFDERSGVSFKNSLVDRTGFPRANIRNLSTKDMPRLGFELALPGWGKENSHIDLYIQYSTLVIKGQDIKQQAENNEECTKDYGKYYEHNISSANNFTWTHTVPENAEIEEANLSNGILTVKVKMPQPKKDEPKHFYIHD